MLKFWLIFLSILAVGYFFGIVAMGIVIVGGLGALLVLGVVGEALDKRSEGERIVRELRALRESTNRL